MRSPLAWAAFFLSLGIWISNIIRVPFLFIAAAAVFSLIAASAMIKKKAASLVCLSAAFLFIGCLLFQARQALPENHIKNFTETEPRELYMEGVVADDPVTGETFYGGKKVTFVLEAERLQEEGIKHEVAGRVRVSLTGEPRRPEMDSPSYGDRILVKGRLSRPAGPGNPGDFDYAAYLARNRIFSILSARAQDASITGKGNGNPVVSLAYKARGKIESLISGNLPGESANFLNAVLLGLRQGMSGDLNDAFMRTGTVHLIAISGLNVGLIVFLVLLVLTVIRVPKKAGIVLTITFLVFYAVLTNGTPSVVRATVMSVALLLGLLLGRENSFSNSLGLAALVILSCDPGALFDIGFQLSFASVISLLYLTPKIEKFFNYERKTAARFLVKWKRYALEAFFVSLSAWIGVMPLILYYFNIVTPVSIAANLVAVPISFLITIASAPFLVFGLIFPPAGKVFAASVWLLCGTLFTANSLFSEIPFAYIYLPRPPLFLIALYYLFVAAFAERERFKLSGARLSAAALVIFNVIIWTGALRAHDGKLRATFLDVGHGDSIFVEFPYGGNMLIDGGTGSGEDRDSGRGTVLPFLRQKGVQVLDAVVLTHPDIDHVGGLASVLEGIKVKYLFDNGAGSDTYAYRRFRRAGKKMPGLRHFILERYDSIEGIKGVNILCFNPPEEWVKDADIPANDASLALRIGYGESVMLFCGDMGEKAISEAMFASPGLLKADLLMLPHHGGKMDARKEAFVGWVKPSYAVVSQGRAAGEMARSKELSDLLSARGIKVFITGKGGAVFAVTDGKDLSVGNFESKHTISR
ncbi:MAG: DNA internalization-related competence protein ComEC/Rec2 [Candidatus Omnitrophica bacterium]|nr:DNA internalization-related competence protein ComEC/Rec2 [Candidatus Omnitrophota bacterium]